MAGTQAPANGPPILFVSSEGRQCSRFSRHMGAVGFRVVLTDRSVARSRRTGGRFAVINDAHGHDVGHAVLTEVGRRIMSTLRDYDTAARMGGDEFELLMHAIERADAVGAAERILRQTALPIHVGKLELNISASIGVAVFPENDLTVKDLLRGADTALCKAKHAGPNAVRLSKAYSLDKEQ